MSDTAYNGWEGKGSRASAYATWRVCLEMGLGDRDDYPDSFDGKPDVDELAEYLRDEVECYVGDMIPDDTAHVFVLGWVEAFLSDVSYEEIAEHILSDWPDDDEDES